MGRMLVTGLILFIVFLLSCDPGKNNREEKNPLADASQSNCENPDANAACCFENIPESLTPVMVIAKDSEPGTRIVITGTIFRPDGKTPFNDIVLYAYHTDATGIYSKTGNEKGVQKYHGRLHGWCRTGTDGRYEIRSIRPASYPDSNNPAHIHSAVMIPGTHRAFYIEEFLFSDDPVLNEKNSRGGAVVEMKRHDALQTGKRDIIIK